MRTLVINGSPKVKNGNTEVFIKQFIKGDCRNILRVLNISVGASANYRHVNCSGNVKEGYDIILSTVWLKFMLSIEEGLCMKG